MTVDEAVRCIAVQTTDGAGHIANYVFRQGRTVGHVRAQLDTSGGRSAALWKIVWTVHWRSEDGQEHRETSTDLPAMLARFGRVDLEKTGAASLDDLPNGRKD